MEVAVTEMHVTVAGNKTTRACIVVAL